MEFLIGSLLSGLRHAPRFAVPALVGIAAGAFAFFATGQQPSSAAIALACAVLGLVVGFVLQHFRDTPSGE